MKDIKSILTGCWVNEYGSKMSISSSDIIDGAFSGKYSSTTGDTGTYNVYGVYDTKPAENECAVSFAISWRSIIEGSDNDQDTFSHSCSAMSGQIQTNGAAFIMPVIHILTTPHKPANTWQNSLVDKLTFTKIDEGN